jgi:hypothetical protein
MELRGVRLKGEGDELRVSTGRVMNAYPDRRRGTGPNATAISKTRVRRDVPKALDLIDPTERWVVSGFFLISTPEARRWSGSSHLWFEANHLRFHIVSLEPWKAGSLSNPAGFETWNFRALCVPEAHHFQLLSQPLSAPADKHPQRR